MPPPRKRPRTQPISGKRPPAAPRPSRSRPSLADENSRPRTLVDLLGGTSSRAEQVLGDDAPNDAWSALANTVDNLASHSRQPNPVDVRDSDQTDRPAGAELQETPHEHLPLDLSIKKSLTIVSSKSLWWTRVRGQGEEYEALHDLLSGVDALPEADVSKPPLGSDAVIEGQALTDSLMQAKRQFYRALLHFRYPCTTLPLVISRRWQAVFSSSGRARPDSALQEAANVAMERLRLWQSALQSLFFGYKRGHIDHFYILLPTTTLLFSHSVGQNDNQSTRNGTKRRGQLRSTSDSTLHACFAKGSLGLRSLLSDYAVPFRLEQGSNQSGEESEPPVIAEGQLAVQAVYNFVLSMGHKISNAADVPVLLCDKPFRGGTAITAQVTDADEANVIDSSGGATRLRYSVKINGLLTPRQVRAVCKALVETQDRDFSVQMSTEARSEMLNVCDQSISLSSTNGTASSHRKTFHAIQGRRVLSRVARDTASPKFLLYTRAVE
ncbi:Donson [Gracilaria domingensis]|nr:Donson [Gracilaria domingensis]